MAGTVTCPHCGAENPRSMLVTICHQCKRDMTRGASGQPVPPRPPSPAAAPPVAPPAAAATPPAPAPAQPAPPPAPRGLITTSASVVTAPSAAPLPPAPQPAEPPALPPPSVDSPTGRVTCPRCGFLNRPSVERCTRCHAPFDQAPAAPNTRRCPRCSQVQEADRITCSHCGLHFLEVEAEPWPTLQRRPTSRAPRSAEEQILSGCGAAFIVFVVLGLAIAALTAAMK